jgi:NDP-sugar pyrophosphorylase family protein
MAEFHGRPFPVHLLDQLVAGGIREVALCRGYRGDEIWAKLGDTYGPLNLRNSHEDEPLGTGGALRLALPWLHLDPLMVMNGDSWINADFQSYLA